MKKVLKACPCVLRRENGRTRILFFEHPTAGRQLVKGTVEPGEPLADAALRELAEESGLTAATVRGKIGVWDRYPGAGPDEAGPAEHHEWHLFEVGMDPEIPVPSGWSHRAEGSPAEEGLVFRFGWMDLDAELDGFAPWWGGVFAQIRAYAARQA